MAEAPAGRERPAAARVERPGSATRGERPGPAVGHSEPAPVQAEQDAGHAGQDAAGQTPVPAEGERPEPPVRRHRRGAGIYGTIITAAVLAAAGPTESVADVAVTVLVTLLVYWIAEQYSDLLGEQLHGGHLPSWRAVGAALATTWSMVSASFIPLAVLLLAGLATASTAAAANAALVVAVLLLMVYAWLAGRAARLRGWQLAVITSLAAVLGLLMIALKDVVILHLH